MCEQAGISTLVPKPLTSSSNADGRFDKRDFTYLPEQDEYRCPAAEDEYRCPAAERAIKRFTTVECGMTIHKYWPSACPKCPIKAQCTSSDYGASRAESTKRFSTQCRSGWNASPTRFGCAGTVEHPFASLKA